MPLGRSNSGIRRRGMAVAEGFFPANSEGERAVHATKLRPLDNLAARISRDVHALKRARRSTSPTAAALTTTSPPNPPGLQPHAFRRAKAQGRHPACRAVPEAGAAQIGRA